MRGKDKNEKRENGDAGRKNKSYNRGIRERKTVGRVNEADDRKRKRMGRIMEEKHGRHWE